MVKISVIGICGNSTFMTVDHFHRKGETLTAKEIYEEMGGKGLNQAVAAARMGAEVSFLAAVGDDIYAEKCEEILSQNHINSFLVRKAGKNTAVAYILTDDVGENQVTEYKSAELNDKDVVGFEKEIKNSDILLLQQEVPQSVNKAAIEIANKYNVRIILNPAPARDIDDVTAKSVFAITPNEQEMLAVNPEIFKNCITTLGSRGCMINKDIIIPSLKVKAVDTTGAGDTFNGVLSVCIAEDMDLKTACEYAVTASGISVGRRYVLNAIPCRNDIENRLRLQHQM